MNNLTGHVTVVITLSGGTHGAQGTFRMDNFSLNGYTVPTSYSNAAPNLYIHKYNYRYGFNGKEKDNDINGEGNDYTATFWEYDSRIGRRWNLDPKPNPSISSYATFENNPVWRADIFGDSVSPERTKGMNFIVVPDKEMRDLDAKTHGGGIKGVVNSAYKADFFAFKRMSKKNSDIKLIEAKTPEQAIGMIKELLGSNGYVKNIIIDYHRTGEEGEVTGFTDEVGDLTVSALKSFKDLAKGYAGTQTTAYLGQCWAGGINNMSNGNLTQPASDALDGATVYGHQAGASSIGLILWRSFAGPIYEKWAKTDKQTNSVGRHTVSYYSIALKQVVSAEIQDRVKFSIDGSINSHVKDVQNLKGKRIADTDAIPLINISAPAGNDQQEPPPPQ